MRAIIAGTEGSKTPGDDRAHLFSLILRSPFRDPINLLLHGGTVCLNKLERHAKIQYITGFNFKP